MRWAIGGLGALLVVCLALVLCRDWIFKAYLKQTLSQRLGCRVELADLETSLGRSRVVLRGLEVFNSAEFGGDVFVRVPELVVELNSGLAAEGRWRLQELRLDVAAVNVVRSREGRVNLDAVQAALAGAGKTGTNNLPGSGHPHGTNAWSTFAGIDYLKLSIGEVQYIDFRHPRRSRKLDVDVRNEEVRNLATREDLQTWLGAFLFRVFLQQLSKPSPGAQEPAVGAPGVTEPASTPGP